MASGCIIAGAGGAAHLPGMLAAKTTLPVIGVPIPTKHLGGLDSLLSIVQMPRGIPVATVAIGNAENAALLAAAILALGDPALAERLAAIAPPDAGRARRPVERLGLTTRPKRRAAPRRRLRLSAGRAAPTVGRAAEPRSAPSPPMLGQVEAEVERGLEQHEDQHGERPRRR